MEVEKKINDLLKLKENSSTSATDNFLRHPSKELIRGLFNMLFELLEGKIDDTIFERKALHEIKGRFDTLYRSGYEKWVILSLIELLDTDDLFHVNLREVSSADLYKLGAISVEEIPNPQKSDSLRFNEYSDEEMFTVPDAILHSKLLKGYISLRAEIGRSLMTASGLSQKREWYPIDDVFVPDSGMILIYLSDNPVEISVVADAKTYCRPDLMIECMFSKNLSDRQELEKVKLRHNILKPRLGTYIIPVECVPLDKHGKFEDGVHILNVGFDQSGLEPIVIVLSKC
jgi:hypothetical protein